MLLQKWRLQTLLAEKARERAETTGETHLESFETNNIVTQVVQAMRMNFRRLEQKRKQDSPPTESQWHERERMPARRVELFYSKTSMSADATAAIAEHAGFSTLDRKSPKPVGFGQRNRTAAVVTALPILSAVLAVSQIWYLLSSCFRIG